MIYLIVVLGTVIAILWKKIDSLGGVVGCLITIILYQAIDLAGIAFIAAFFLVGTLASVYGLREKNRLHIAEAKQGRRGWKNVTSNSGAATVVAITYLIFPGFIQNPELAIAVCFAAALSDTLSSEMGNLTGRRYFSILTAKPALRGEDGVVSWSGFAWGVLGSSMMAIVYGFFYQFNYSFVVVILLGFIGNLLDSLFGASLQAKGYLSNNGVNLVSTTCVTLLALFFTLRLG
ncbi:MAG: TIGR00297 family protein [Cyclobacteriaceae bacterium]